MSRRQRLGQVDPARSDRRLPRAQRRHASTLDGRDLLPLPPEAAAGLDPVPVRKPVRAPDAPPAMSRSACRARHRPSGRRADRRGAGRGRLARHRRAARRHPVGRRRSSAWRWRARCCATGRCCCSTNRSRRSTTRPARTIARTGADADRAATTGITILVSHHADDVAALATPALPDLREGQAVRASLTAAVCGPGPRTPR